MNFEVFKAKGKIGVHKSLLWSWKFLSEKRVLSESKESFWIPYMSTCHQFSFDLNWYLELPFLATSLFRHVAEGVYCREALLITMAGDEENREQ